MIQTGYDRCYRDLVCPHSPSKKYILNGSHTSLIFLYHSEIAFFFLNNSQAVLTENFSELVKVHHDLSAASVYVT